MSNGIICGFETGSAVEAQAIIGSASIQNSITRGAWSLYAGRVNPTTTNTGFITLRGHGANGATSTSAYNASTAFVRFYFRVDTLPASNDEEFFILRTSSSVQKLSLRIRSDGKISAYDNIPTLIATGTAVLSTGIWYRIEVKGGTGSGAVVEWKIDGVIDVSTTATLSGVNTGFIDLGKVNNRNSQTVDYYFDDILCSNSAYPGEGQCGILVPSANGTYQNWTVGAGSGSHYQLLDEIPHNSDTDYLVSTLNTTHAETEAMQDSSVLGITGTINCVQPCIVVKRDGAGTNGSAKLRYRSASTDTDLTAFSTTNTYVLLAKLLDTDPATSLAWTTSGLDGVEVGIVEASTTDKSRITAAYLVVDWTPSNSQTATPDIATITISGIDEIASPIGSVTLSPGVGIVSLSSIDLLVTGSGQAGITPSTANISLLEQDIEVTGSGIVTIIPGICIVNTSSTDTLLTPFGSVTITPNIAIVNITGFSPEPSHRQSDFILGRVTVTPITFGTVSISPSMTGNITINSSILGNITLDPD